MTVPDPRQKSEDTGHGSRTMIRAAVVAGVTVFLFLVAYFLIDGPLNQEEAAYPPAGGNAEVEGEAAPPKQPTP